MELIDSLRAAMADRSPARGLGHDFYPYPARMAPAVARFLIRQFSEPGDLVLDPFMGSGTAIVEALAAGRRAIGVDINPLAGLLTSARTTPLSSADVSALKEWACAENLATAPPEARWDTLPNGQLLAAFAASAQQLKMRRRREAASAALLKIGKWALDCRDQSPSEEALRLRLIEAIGRLFHANEDLCRAASQNGIARRHLAQTRRLLVRSAVGIADERQLADARGAVRLVVTSPPYPSVHVLYHRWQLHSRRETAAPYWLIASPDGHGPAYYTMGGRSGIGLERYFTTLREALGSLRPLLARDARVCFLVAFRDPTLHLALFREAARESGFEPAGLPALWREVPNRRWYAKRQATHGAAQEVLLILRPRRPAPAEPPLGLRVAVPRSV